MIDIACPLCKCWFDVEKKIIPFEVECPSCGKDLFIGGVYITSTSRENCLKTESRIAAWINKRFYEECAKEYDPEVGDQIQAIFDEVNNDKTDNI